MKLEIHFEFRVSLRKFQDLNFWDATVTGFPIGDILHNKEAIGRIAKWAYELGAHDIEFRPRTAVKTQALVDFVSEWTE
jgi:hypothetical protein